MADLVKELNRELQRDFPDGRLTHEPILPRSGVDFPPARHTEINGGGATKVAGGLTIAEQLDHRIEALQMHVAEIRRLCGEIGQ